MYLDASLSNKQGQGDRADILDGFMMAIDTIQKTSLGKRMSRHLCEV
jgi:hypothetical protein